MVDITARIKSPAEAPALVAEAFRAMRSGRPGPAALECAIDVWGKQRRRCAAGRAAADCTEPPIDEDAVARGRQAPRRAPSAS